MANSLVISRGRDRRPIAHPAVVRLTHWINAAAMVVMVMSGLQIYNASPIFPFLFHPQVTLGGWLGHPDITLYNGIQKLLYAGVLVIILIAVLSGFAIWKPAQLSLLTDLFGGFQGARKNHEQKTNSSRR